MSRYEPAGRIEDEEPFSHEGSDIRLADGRWVRLDKVTRKRWIRSKPSYRPGRGPTVEMLYLCTGDEFIYVTYADCVRYLGGLMPLRGDSYEVLSTGAALKMLRDWDPQCRLPKEVEHLAPRLGEPETDAADEVDEQSTESPPVEGGDEPGVVDAGEGEPPAPPPLADSSLVTAAEIARALGCEVDPVRKRLERLRHNDHTCYVELQPGEASIRGAKYLYIWGKVKDTVAVERP